MKKLFAMLVLVMVCVGQSSALTIEWGFDSDGDYEGWVDAADRMYDSVSDGVLSCSYKTADPQWVRTTGLESIDLSEDFTCEVRMRRTAGSSAAFLMLVVNGSAVAGATMEDHADWQVMQLNYSGGRLAEAGISNFRFDPFRGLPEEADGAWEIDYIKVQQDDPPPLHMLTIEWDFDSDGNYEGWTDVADRMFDSVSGGVLACSYKVADPQWVRTEGLSTIDLSRDFTMEVKMRRTVGTSAASLMLVVNGTVSAAVTMAENDNWQVLQLNYAGGKVSDPSVSQLRFDPFQGIAADADGAWEIDYIKLLQENPQPAKISLISFHN